MGKFVFLFGAVACGVWLLSHREEVLAQQRPGAASPNAAIEAAIRNLLDAQLKAWNAGDVEAFMEYYWKSDDLTFSSGGKTTRSWKATLDRYRERYPTRAAMGTTTFKNLEITPLCDTAAMVLGEWQLRRESGETIGGNFSLVLRRIDGKWLIIHDHTSQAAAS
ncbi:MAG: nuclear transport factor 2 family protein [Pirellulales bacterium]